MWTPLHRLLTALAPRRASEKLKLLGCAGLLMASTSFGHAQAIAAQGLIDLRNHSIAIDSFDSSAPDYPGYWTNTIRKAGGDVFSAIGITNGADVGIGGHLMTGPAGFVSLSGNLSIGDLPWVDSATPGIKPGWFSNNITVTFKDVVIPGPPQMVWSVAPGSGTVYADYGPELFAHVITIPGNYILSDNGDIYVATNVAVNLKVLPTVGTFSPNNFYAAGKGTNSAKVTCYVDCTNCNFGATDRPQSGLAQNMVFLGTPNCSSLSYKGNGDFVGTLYFPQANFQLSGGGSGIIDFLGCSVTKTIRYNGNYDIHFDEALYRQSLPMLLFSTGPQNRAALLGRDTSVNVSAVGAQPIGYQWRFGGSDIPDATNSSLSLTNIQLADAGLYEAVITNISGSVTSQVQVAVYDSPIPTLQLPAVSTNGMFQVTISGISDFKYAVEVSTNLADWFPIATNASPYVFSDTNAVVLPQQFYRAVYVP